MDICSKPFSKLLNQVIISNLPKPLETTELLLILVPPNATLEYGIDRWVTALSLLMREMTASIEFYADEEDRIKLIKLFKKRGISLKDTGKDYNPDAYFARQDDNKQELFVMINARKFGVSYDLRHWNLTYKVPQLLPNQNVLMIYPEQAEVLVHVG